jgi:hypothetical protein
MNALSVMALIRRKAAFQGFAPDVALTLAAVDAIL